MNKLFKPDQQPKGSKGTFEILTISLVLFNQTKEGLDIGKKCSKGEMIQRIAP